jgi:glyoxylase-like metal-dependent hydrolase (beta-lactamase superfamily II)
MKNARAFLLAGFAGLASLAFFAARSDAKPETVSKIADGVWFREGGVDGHCNNTIIEMKDYLIVVDANFPNGARLALEDAKKISAKPVKYVFDTHHHGDHSYGNAVWTEAGATTLAYKGVAEEMKRHEPTRWQSTAKTRKDVADLNRTSVEPPKQTFDKNKFVLSDSSRTVEFHFFGWAHTRGDGFVYIPKEQVLCTGDAVVNGAYNYVEDGNIANWPNVIRAAQKLKIAHVLPGHGEPATKDLLDGQILYFTELQKAVKSAMSQGKKLEDLVTMRNGAAVSTTVTLPDTVKKWVGGSLALHVQAAYQEAAQKKPYGEITGGK